MILLVLLLWFLVPEWWERLLHARGREPRAPLERRVSPIA
jgi:hypothetical protein